MKRLALLLFLFPVLICWGGENQQPSPPQEKDVPVSSIRAELNDPYSDSIRVSYFIIPPHVFLDENEKVRGAIYDLMEKHISPKVGVKFKWDTLPASQARQLKNLRDGKKYISCLLIFIPKRREVLIYSKNPYYYAQSIIAIQKSNPLKEVKSASDISHMVFGYFQNAYITPFMMDPSIKFDLVGSHNFLRNNLKKVIHHRIDGVYSPGKASSLFYSTFGIH